MPTTSKRLPFVQLDVFSSVPLEGNPLAVFPDARGLSDEEMQAIARELNLSETTFVLPRDAAVEKERGVRVRIFTVQEELPFAGHPTLGTAFALRGENGTEKIKLDLNMGTIPVRFEGNANEIATTNHNRVTFGEMTQADPVFGLIHVPQQVAKVTGIPIEDIEPALPIQTVSTGLPYTILPLRGLEAMRRLNINHPKATEYLNASGGKFFFCVTRETVDPSARLH